MKLMVITPTAVVLEADDVRYVRAEDSTGAFGIQPGHADLLTVLVISVVIWRDATDKEHYVAVRGGVLRVRSGEVVEVASREAVVGENLAELRQVVLAQMAAHAEGERAARVGALGLQHAAIQHLYRYLRPSERSRDPLVRKP